MRNLLGIILHTTEDKKNFSYKKKNLNYTR